MDPYRSGTQIATCPRCANSIESDGVLGRLVCTQGCGEWYSRASLEASGRWPDPVQFSPVVAAPWPWSNPACPICRADMAINYRAELRFDYCQAHGIWFDAGEFDRFVATFKRPSRS